jgi:hypothetical protein
MAGVVAFNISESKPRKSLLPDTVVDPATGAAIKRPERWY